MRYVSTRGEAAGRGFAAILLEGLAPDGGLYLPEEFARIELKALRGRPYVDLAAGILARYMDDVPELGRIVRATYTARVFGADDITPLKRLERGLYLLCLSNGPTLAFKDIALQLLGGLFERILEDSFHVATLDNDAPQIFEEWAEFVRKVASP